MQSQPEIWLPTSQMHVSVAEGKVIITETMTMERKKVKKIAGFVKEEKNAVEHPAS